ncbi:MAG: hypothetical protein HKO68_20960 [Desulfobacterales bacterium]|nr:hypothetical protein [Desulfobacterales bacterium]
MEDLPQITESVCLPVNIPIYPYLLDHCFLGKPVFPAVEAMQVLAQAVIGYAPDADITAITEAKFNKFLYIRDSRTQIAATCDATIFENGDITAVLKTKSKSERTAITRTKEHVAIRIPHSKPIFPAIPFELGWAGFEIDEEISAGQIYRDLVPFGPAYHNILDTLYISDEGAIAKLSAPKNDDQTSMPGPLGSPFVLDAAFHTACAWGQRYAQIVAFPIGIEKRIIFKPTQAGKTYMNRITPVRKDPDLLVFDMWIFDENGIVFESTSGVHMRDVSGGRLKPPRWIIDNAEKHSL